MSRSRGLAQISLVLIVMAIAALWLYTSSFAVSGGGQTVASDGVAKVYAGHEVDQAFMAAQDNVSRVKLLIFKARMENPGSLRLELLPLKGRRADGSPLTGKVISRIKLDLASFDTPGEVHTFEFDPVPLSKGKNYLIRLTSDNPAGNAVSLIGKSSGNDNGVKFKGGVLFQDQDPAHGSLYFVLYHNIDIAGLLAKIVPYRPWPLSSAILFEALFLLAAGSFGWLLGEIGFASGEIRESAGMADAEGEAGGEKAVGRKAG